MFEGNNLIYNELLHFIKYVQEIITFIYDAGRF